MTAARADPLAIPFLKAGALGADDGDGEGVGVTVTADGVVLEKIFQLVMFRDAESSISIERQGLIAYFESLFCLLSPRPRPRPSASATIETNAIAASTRYNFRFEPLGFTSAIGGGACGASLLLGYNPSMGFCG